MLIHGTSMWIVWGLFSFVMLSSNRYLKAKLISYRMWIHRIFGTLILLFTVTFSLQARQNLKWVVINNLHSYLTYAVLSLVFVLVISGVATRSILRRCIWNTRFALRFKKFHKIFAHCVTLLGNLACASGIYYYRTNPKHSFNFALEWLSLGFFVFLFLSAEVLYQKYLLAETAFDPEGQFKNKIISIKEFDERVKTGEKLVVLDDYVLDVKSFLNEHPGAKFSIE